MAYISITYSEAGREVALDYKNVYLSYNIGSKKVEKLFESGDFVKDWFDCKRFIVLEGISEREYTCHSSSVDHFIMDGAPFESAYLHFENDDEPILKYVDRTEDGFLFTQSDIFMNGSELFVDPGTKPTWDELRVRCGYEPRKKD